MKENTIKPALPEVKQIKDERNVRETPIQYRKVFNRSRLKALKLERPLRYVIREFEVDLLMLLDEAVFQSTQINSDFDDSDEEMENKPVVKNEICKMKEERIKAIKNSQFEL